MVLKRFAQLPISLYRIQASSAVSLREYAAQMAKGLSPYDLKTYDGKVLPVEGDDFHTPNGMLVRPFSEQFLNYLRNYKGDPLVYCFPVGLRLPHGIVAIHEYSDHWSFQTTRPVLLEQFNEKLKQFLDDNVSVTRDLFLEIQQLNNDEQLDH